jgi:hypothetical protein
LSSEHRHGNHRNVSEALDGEARELIKGLALIGLYVPENVDNGCSPDGDSPPFVPTNPGNNPAPQWGSLLHFISDLILSIKLRYYAEPMNKGRSRNIHLNCPIF